MGFSHVITSAKLSQQLVKLISEVLSGKGGKADAREIVRLALSDVVETFDPSDRIQLDLFMHGELVDAIESVVGEARVDEIVSHVVDSVETPRPPPSSGVTPAITKRQEAKPLALVITDDRALRAEVIEALAEGGFAHSECGAYPLDVVSECQVTKPVCVIYDVKASPGRVGRLAKRMRQALQDAAPPAIVLLPRGARAEDVELSGQVGAVFQSAVARELVKTVNRVRDEPKGPPQSSEMKKPRRQRTSRGMRRRNRRTFDHVLGEALSTIASDRLLKAVLDTALAEAELEQLPSKIGPFEKFVSGPLRISVTTLLGEASYHAVQSALEPVVRQARGEKGGMVKVVRREAKTRKHIRCLLIVHRDEAELRRLRDGLEAHCTTVLTATCGYRALGMAIKDRPQIVIADLETPNVPGPELISQLGDLLGDEVPAFVIVGGREPAEVDGASHVVGSPVDVDKLLDLVT